MSGELPTSRQQRAMRGKAVSPSLKCAPQFDVGMSKVHLPCCTQPLVPQGKFSLRFIGYMDR